MISQPTLNQLYYGMNRRFDKRCRVMLKMGYKYKHGAKGCYAVFVANDGKWNRSEVPTAIVMHASNRVWADQLKSLRPR